MLKEIQIWKKIFLKKRNKLHKYKKIKLRRKNLIKGIKVFKIKIIHTF